jgi:colicin import membrane protein
MAKSEEVKEVRVKPDLEKYVNGVSGAGKRTKRSDHPVAAALDGFTIDETYTVASKFCEISEKELRDKYGHLNVGMQRMNLGNRIRGEVNKRDKAHEADKAVVVGLKALAFETEKPRAAATKRGAAQAKAKSDREAKAEANAKAKEKEGKAKKAA